MTFLRAALATGFTLLTLADPAQAGFINSGFEQASFAGWDTAGDALVTANPYAGPAREGDYLSLLTTSSQNGDAHTHSGTDAVSAAALEAFLGLAAGTLEGGPHFAVEGSAIKQSFTVAAGDKLSFSYRFLTTEGPNPDFAFAVLGGNSVLGDSQSGPFEPSLFDLDPVFGDATRETPWRTFSHTFAAGGTYTLGVGVADAGDEFLPSGLVLDAFTISGSDPTSPNPVPAPGGLVLFLSGVATYGLARIRRRGRTIAGVGSGG